MPDLSASSRPRVSPTRRAGAAGFAHYGGYLVDQDKSADLRGQTKFKTYSELIANVEIIGACVRFYLNMVGRVDWTVEPAEGGGARAQEVADLVEEILHGMERPWSRVVRRAAMYRPLGYSWQEWIAKRRPDGVIGFLDVEPRTQSTIVRWDVDEESGGILGVWQESPQTYQEHYIPRAKSFYVVDDSISDSPDGLGILRHAAPAAKALQQLERLEGIGFETDLRGIPVGKAPLLALAEKVNAQTITQATADLIVATIEGFVTDRARAIDTGIVIDSSVYSATSADGTSPSGAPMWGIELLSAANTNAAEIAGAIDRKTRGIARLFQLEGILLGESGSGSLAMARSKAKGFASAVEDAVDEVAGQAEKDLVRPLAALNGWPEELLPSLKPARLQNDDLDEIGAFIESLARAGSAITPGEPAEHVLRDAVGLPRREELEIEQDAGLRGAPRGGDRTRQPEDEPVPEPADADDEPEQE